jgi:hypothetical protein
MKTITEAFVWYEANAKALDPKATPMNYEEWLNFHSWPRERSCPEDNTVRVKGYIAPCGTNHVLCHLCDWEAELGKRETEESWARDRY